MAKATHKGDKNGDTDYELKAAEYGDGEVNQAKRRRQTHHQIRGCNNARKRINMNSARCIACFSKQSNNGAATTNNRKRNNNCAQCAYGNTVGNTGNDAGQIDPGNNSGL